MRVVVPGPPRGKDRPRFVRATGRTYTTTPTLRAEQRIREAWQQSGYGRVDGEPLELFVGVVLERPKTHYRVNGGLSAAGRRSSIPMRKPDVDNTLKLVCDALNGVAYCDDVQIVDARVRRRWAAAGESACTIIILEFAETPDISYVDDPEWQPPGWERAA